MCILQCLGGRTLCDLFCLKRDLYYCSGKEIRLPFKIIKSYEMKMKCLIKEILFIVQLMQVTYSAYH
jgi:hypothetical protein